MSNTAKEIIQELKEVTGYAYRDNPITTEHILELLLEHKGAAEKSLGLYFDTKDELEKVKKELSVEKVKSSRLQEIILADRINKQAVKEFMARVSSEQNSRHKKEDTQDA